MHTPSLDTNLYFKTAIIISVDIDILTVAQGIPFLCIYIFLCLFLFIYLYHCTFLCYVYKVLHFIVFFFKEDFAMICNVICFIFNVSVNLF